jgi:hypothetical protein
LFRSLELLLPSPCGDKQELARSEKVKAKVTKGTAQWYLLCNSRVYRV